MRLNHVCIVVRDEARAKRFYVDRLGLTQHPDRDSWLRIGSSASLHLVGVGDDLGAIDLRGEIQHLAIEVPSLRESARALSKEGIEIFQMDFEGNERAIDDPEGPLDFGIGTIFVRDPDENLVELIEPGKGIY
jgi:catechol 2,3-dioxygenase-like lactoylglutathione lyase family enzyme